MAQVNESTQGNNFVTMEVVRELLTVQRETILCFFKETTNCLNQRLDTVCKEVNELKTSVTFTGDVCDNKVNKVIEDLDVLKKDLSNLKNENVNIRTVHGKMLPQLCEMKQKHVEQEDRSRRNNLRITGIEEDENESWDATKAKAKTLFREKLEIPTRIDIERAHRVKRRNENGENRYPRTIVLKLLNFEDKETILKNSNKLKGMNIFINEDYSEETMQLRKSLFAQARVIREQGSYAKVVYNRLIVNERAPEVMSVFGN